MGTVMTSLPPVSSPAANRVAGSMFGPVAADVEEADRIFTAALAEYRSPVAPLIEHLRHYRGKRLRPALLLIAAKAVGPITPAHHTLAAAVEMIHTATLVHDDVLDEADVRRHTSTVNAEWGNKVSILLGDMLFTHAFHLTSTVDGRACRIIGEATNRVCAGELLQIRERGNWNLTEAEYFAIIEGKTAALTECCGRLGALYAGASDDTAERLASYGRNLGLAFQIADDLLDLTGREETVGKTLGTDLAQQKLTLPVIHCVQRLSRGESVLLRETLQAGHQSGRSQLLDVLERSGSILYARRKAEETAGMAQAELATLPRSESRSLLESLADWAIRRMK